MNRKKLLLIPFILLTINLFITSDTKDHSEYESFYQKERIGIGNLKYFVKAYPELKFKRKYDRKLDDWKITVIDENREFIFYWCDGKMLPPAALPHKDEYWSILTTYPKDNLDPKDYTPAIIEDIRELGSPRNRYHSKGPSMFFFDSIYDAEDQDSTETHIARLPFINRWINVHEKLEEPLNKVSEKMFAAAKKNKEVKDFIDSIKVYEAYSWREITGTQRKSFHSLGIAIDALPRELGRKQIFWNWTRRYNPENWMCTPLSDRWMPPESVIKIFESEGFAWGGKWALFDNMHFEYRPELLLYNKIN